MERVQESIEGFYYHEKFGDVPTGWEVKSIDKCFDFFPTASFSRSALSENGECGYIHYGDIHTKFHRFLDLDKCEVPYISYDMAKRFTKLKDGDLIISDASEDYEGVGKTVEVLNVKNRSLISGLHTLHLRPKEGEFTIGFTGYLLYHNKVRLYILRSATGIKVYSVSKTELKRILFPKPPKTEQTAIAAILSKVDEAIEAAQNSIKAAEKLKKALMQNLLTGKLKPDGPDSYRERTDDEFYVDEKFGKVPIGWHIIKGNKITSKITKGQSPKWQGFEYQEKGILFITSENVRDGYIEIENPKYLPIEFHNKIKNSQLQKGDVLINIVGASIGRSAVFNLDIEYANTNQAVCVFRPNAENDSNFLAFYIQDGYTQQRLLGTQVETARANLSLGDFRKFKFVIPETKDEQILLSDKISEVNTAIESKQTKIRTLQRLKKSLMQNLLTGKVRLSQAFIEQFESGMSGNPTNQANQRILNDE